MRFFSTNDYLTDNVYGDSAPESYLRDFLVFETSFYENIHEGFSFGGSFATGTGFDLTGFTFQNTENTLADGPVFADTLGTIDTMATITVNSQITDVLEISDDEDWYSITLTAGETYDISSIGTGGSPLSDPLLRILDSTGTELATNDDIINGDVRHSLLTFTATETGTYFISAEAWTTQTGGYTLSVTEVAAADIAGDTSTTAVAIVDGSVSGTLETTSDSDWFSITLSAGSRYLISDNGAGGTALADTFLTLYDAQGNVVLSNDNGGPDNNSKLGYTVETTGTYYIGASSRGGGQW